jgi:hypothetical protein
MKSYFEVDLIEEKQQKEMRVCRNLPGFGGIIFLRVSFEENCQV